MKKNILISVVLATIILVGCNTESDTEVKDVHVQAVQDAQEAVTSLVEKAKEIKKAQEMDKVVPQEKVIEEVNTTSVAVVDGATLFKKCSSCHGEDGQKSAFQKSAIIAGQNVETLVASITEYKAGTRDVAGMGKLMKGQVTELSEDDIQTVAEYISTL